jgi:coenzyme F420-0:L-glutamate ligase / coenzyme F420-1:gamma-L-glutamate ligase
LLSSDLSKILRSRRSVRRFLPRPVSAEVLESLLATAIQAPSAHNRQPWRFVVLTKAEAKIKLADAMGSELRADLLADGMGSSKVEAQVDRSRNRIVQAPVLILLCLDASDMDSYPDPGRQKAEHMMAVQSVALSGGYLLLAAHAEGLGGVWMCAPLFAQRVVLEALNLPGHWEPQGMLLIGYPAITPEPRLRKPLSESVRFL